MPRRLPFPAPFAATLALALLAPLGACKKEVAGPAASKALGNREGAEEGDAKGDTGKKTSEIEAKQSDLEKRLEDEIAARMKEDAAIRFEMDGLRKRLDELEAKLKDDIARLDGKDKAIDEEITRLKATNAEIGQFIVFANQNFATKAELAGLAEVVGGLSATVNVLQGKVTDLDQKVDRDVAAVRDDMAKGIRGVRAEVASVRSELKGQIRLFAATYQRLLLQTYAQLQDVQAQVSRLDRKVDGKLTVALAKLAGRVTDLEGFRASVTQELDAKFAELDAKDASLGQAVRDARAEAKDELAKAVAESNAQRNVLALKVEETRQEVARVAAVAEQAARMAETNARDLVALREDLAEARGDFARQIDALTKAFDDKLADVRRLAQAVTVSLGIQVQARFVSLNGGLADTEQRAAQILMMIANLFADVLTTPVERNNLIGLAQPQADELTAGLGGVIDHAAQVEKAFIDAFDPVLNKGGVNNAALNQSFKALASSCPDEAGFNDYYAAVRSREWFFHLARAYVRQLLFGTRGGAAGADRVFFARAPFDGSEFAVSLLTGVLPPYAASSSRTCLVAVDTWARDVLFGEGADSAALRESVAKSPAVAQAVAGFFGQVERVRTSGDAYLSLLIGVLAPKLGGEAGCRAYLAKVQAEGWTLLARMAKMFGDRAQFASVLRDLRADRERILELARRVNANEKDIADLRSRVDELGRTVDRETAKLTESQRTAFSLIAAIAGRLGYDDLVAKAAAAAAKAGGTVDPSLQNMPARCVAAQHFYNHATDKNQAVSRCESNMSVYGRDPLDATAMTRCAVHGAWYQGSELVAYTWGNARESANGWDAQDDTSGGQKVGNGLLIRQYEPTDAKAKELAVRAGGSVYPADGEATFMLRVLGAADRFRIDVTSMNNPSQSPYSVTVNAAEFQVSGGANKLVYEIPLPKAVAPLGACRWDREIRVTALDKSGTPGPESCVHRFHTFSPLVLSFAGPGVPRTENPLTSRARFDLDANGHKESTGWIRPGQALLARDRDGNGVIDDGRELFGEATLLPDGRTAANGYEALAALDADGDGLITPADPAYGELLLWFDNDQDGNSKPHELRTLAQAGVTAVETRYRPVEEGRRLDAGGMPEGNVILYTARFFGPSACGRAGCPSFDVYFGAAESFALRAP